MDGVLSSAPSFVRNPSFVNTGHGKGGSHATHQSALLRREAGSIVMESARALSRMNKAVRPR
jgi:hypothetical protein